MARNENMIAALLRERAGYVARGLTDRVRQVDEQLRHYGHTPDEDPTLEAEGGPKDREAPEDRKSTADSERRGRGRPRKPRDAQGNIIRE